jgi:uncharacterized protein involved in outer membrane biogenesis
LPNRGKSFIVPVMKKALIVLLSIIVVVVVGLYFVGGTIISKAAVAGVETFVPKMTKTSVEMESLHVSPLTGAGTIKGFSLGKPEGFKSGHSVAFDSVHLDVAPMSILGDRILIEKVHVYGPKFNYERKLTTSNIKEILANVQAAAGITGDEPVEEETGEPIKIEIKELIIDEGEIAMTVAGATVPVPLPRIVLTNIGTDEGGITPNEMALEVMSVVFNQVLGSVAKAPGAAVEGVKNVNESISKGIKGLFGGGDD